MTVQPLISVVTATRNRTELLGRALRSIAAQNFTDYEAVVVDDGSDVEIQQYHEELLSSLPDTFQFHRVRAPGSAGAGPGTARNAGITRARGKYLAFLDDDDWWIASDHLSVAAETLQRVNADFFFANMQGMKGENVLKPDWFPDSPRLTSGQRIMESPPVYELSLASFLRVMRNHFSHPNCWVVRHDLVHQAGGFWDKVRIGEDYSLMMRIADRAARILYRPDCVCAYRFPDGNAVSLTYKPAEEHVQLLLSAVQVAATCNRRDVRRCARARQSWHLRQLAKILAEEERSVAALPFNWEAVCVYPTLGGLAQFARTLLKAVGRAWQDGPATECTYLTGSKP